MRMLDISRATSSIRLQTCPIRTCRHSGPFPVIHIARVVQWTRSLTAGASSAERKSSVRVELAKSTAPTTGSTSSVTAP